MRGCVISTGKVYIIKLRVPYTRGIGDIKVIEKCVHLINTAGLKFTYFILFHMSNYLKKSNQQYFTKLSKNTNKDLIY